MKIAIDEEQREYLQGVHLWAAIDGAIAAWANHAVTIDDAGMTWEWDGGRPVIASDDRWDELASDIAGVFRDRLETAMAERLDREEGERA